MISPVVYIVCGKLIGHYGNERDFRGASATPNFNTFSCFHCLLEIDLELFSGCVCSFRFCSGNDQTPH